VAASKSPKSSKSDEDAKAINPSDLDPDELAKAIEESVAAESKPAASAKTPEKDAENSGKKDNKAKEPEADEEAATADKHEEDKGVPIIVKRHSGYVSPPVSTPKAAEDEPEEKQDEKTLEPPSKTQKTLDPQTSSQQPAAGNEKVQEPTKPEDSPAVDKNEVAKETEKPAEPKPTETAQSPADTDSPAAKVSADEPAKTSAEEAVAPEGAKDPTAEGKLQKPTVFDTTEYHLPIKARNRKYVNSAVAWTVLAIVFAAAACYVLYRLGVIEVGDLRTFN
jgi:hypothetical protein